MSTGFPRGFMEHPLAMESDTETDHESEESLSLAEPSSNSDASRTVKSNADPLGISSPCLKCQEDLDGPCYEHADVSRIIFDKAPIPLAHSSLPDALEIFDFQPLRQGVMVCAKRQITASTLFGPLIAPLVPLDELKSLPLRYTLWSEETEELQAYELSDDFLCNWIKFVRPSANAEDANVIAYQQRGSVYLVAVRDILPTTELRVYIKLPKNGSIPSEHLSALVQSLLYSYDRQKVQTRQLPEAGEVETELAVRKRGKGAKRKQFEEAKEVESVIDTQEGCDAEVSLTVEAGNADLERTEEIAPKRKRTRRTRKVEALNEEALVDKSVATCSRECCPDGSEGAALGGSVSEEGWSETATCAKPSERWRKLVRRQSKDWYLLRARYKAGERTLQHADDEKVVNEKRKREAREWHARKAAQMTEDERRAYLAGKKEGNIRNAANNNKLIKLVREKYLQGCQLQYDAYLKASRERNDLTRRKQRIAQGKDPDEPKQTYPRGRPAMFAWQLAGQTGPYVVDEADEAAARCEPVQERTKGGTAIPSYRLKLRQGLPLTSEEKAAHQRMLVRSREENRRYYKRKKLAAGLDPKEAISRRKTPLEGRDSRTSKDTTRNSAEDSNGT